ncbi:MAG: hypothetical protein K2M43_02435 [Mycoplasmoidaceae bacterium]|nr:hypothetical protein [Mycoplasmoidaceae bacterium]
MELNKNLNKLASLLLAKAIKDIYPEVVLGEPKVNDEAFSYSFKFADKNVSANDFGKIKKQMEKNIDRAYELKFESMSKNDLLKYFEANPYKVQIINEMNQESIPVCKFGNDFIDICEDLKIQKLSVIKAIELLNVSGCY